MARRNHFGLIGALALFAFAFSMQVSASMHAQASGKPDIVEVVTIDGVIDDGAAVNITKQIEAINDNRRIKAVLLIVDSPGGGVLASAVIYEELAKLRVPVVGWCNNLCASGGMYVLMSPSVKYIGVRTQTISGSIGVIMNITRFNRLLDWAKIDSETYKSGDRKDSGNPTRALTEDERQDLQGTIDVLAQHFYGLVAKSRGSKIGTEQWQEIKRAGIFFGQQGVNIGLVDAVMTKDEALTKAKQLSGSALIFTRDELRKMSKDAETTGGFNFETPAPQPMLQPWGDLPWLIETLKEIRAGESIKIAYLLPYRF